MAGITLGNVYGLMVVTVFVDIASIAANTTVEQSFNVPGVRLGDMVIVTTASAVNAGVFVASARVTAANTVALRVGNVTVGALDPVAQDCLFFVIRPDAGVRVGVAM